jgi:VCBS repeat-containing protein
LGGLAVQVFDTPLRAATVVVPPNPGGGQQARADGVLLGMGSYFARFSGVTMAGNPPYLFFQAQIDYDKIDLFLGINGFNFWPGSGYAVFGYYPVNVVSSGGSGASLWVNTSFYPSIFNGLSAITLGAPGHAYTDDATVVIDPPHKNDFQSALDNTNATIIQLQTGTYFQNATINRDVTIRGEGVGKTIVDGAKLGSVFKILPGKTVVLEDMSIVNGLAQSGGGIFNDGNLTVNRCEIANNRAYKYLTGEGGGIYNRGGARLTIRDSIVRDNIAERDGGGISSSGFNLSTLPFSGGGSASNIMAGSISDMTNGLPTNLNDLSDTNQQQAFAEQLESAQASRLPSTNSPSTKDFLEQLLGDPFTNQGFWLAIGSPVCVISNTVIANNKVGAAGAVAAIQTPLGNTRLPRLLCFGAGVHSDLGLLTIQDSTLTGNELSSDFGNFGGGVSSMFGALKVSNSKLNNNRISTTTILGMGGAVYSFGCYTRVSDSQMNSNKVGALFLSSGGAMKNTFASYTEMDRCQLNDNTSGGGGAMANDYYGILQLNDSTMLRNSVSGVIGANGGGLRNDEAGQAVLTRCTISGNSATGRAKGGGLYNECTMVRIATYPVIFASTLTLRNCTISSNLVDGQGIFGIPLTAQGAGIFNGSSKKAAANTFISACTIYGNRATNGLSHVGGGVFSTARSSVNLSTALTNNGLSLVEFANTLLARNEPQDCNNSTLTVTTFMVSLGYNMDSDGTGGNECLLSDSLLSSDAQFRTAGNPLLGSLQNNGGPTPTHALLPGSPAIDVGAPDGYLSTDFSPADDQRGLARSLGGRRDIGAFESTLPSASGETYTTLEDLPLVIDAFSGVLSNDFATGLRAILVTSAAHGSLNLAPDGSFAYVPATNYNGMDSFAYRVVDASSNASSVVTATIMVSPRLDWLTMVPAPGATAERYVDVKLTFDETVSSNAIAANVILKGSQSGPHGFTVSISGTNATLNPSTDFTIGEQVAVTVSSNLTSVAGSAHFPTEVQSFQIFSNRPPVGITDAYTVAEDGVLQINSAALLANDYDPDGDQLTFLTNIVVTGTLLQLADTYGEFMSGNNMPFYVGTYPSGSWALTVPPLAQHGTLDLSTNGTFAYRPETNYNGTDTFQYRISDGFNPPVSVTVTINVTPVNDPPVAVPDYYPLGTLSVDSTNGVLANDFDIDSSASTFRALLVTQTMHGSVALSTNGSFTYSPTNGYTGSDVFTYSVKSGNTTSAPARVKIGNTAPLAGIDLYPRSLGVPVVITNSNQGLLANDSDPDGDSPLTSWLDTPPTNGTVVINTDGTFTYTPNAGFTNTDAFTYHINDGIEDSLPARVKIGNTTPVAINDSNYLTFTGQQLTVPAAQGVLSNDTDTDGDQLTAQLVTTTTHGALLLNANGTFTYSPNSGYVGTDSFTYRASDEFTNSATVIASITVYDYLHVAARSPLPNSGTAASNAPIQITFNAPISASTVSNRVVIHGAFSGRHTYSFTVNSNIVNVQPTGIFRPGELVSVSLLAGIRGTGFFQLQNGFNWSFTTRAPRGSAIFTRSTLNTNVYAAYSVATGDLNGDGRMDVLVLCQTAPPQIYFNLGNRSFTNRAETLGLDWSFTLPSTAIIGDFNGDGVPDILVSQGSSTARVGLNNGNGTFTPVDLPHPPSGVKFLATGDFNGDGSLDVVGAFLNGVIWIWLNDGTGHFTLGPSLNVLAWPSNSIWGMAVGDLDGNGALDVYLTCSKGDKLLLNDGTGNFTVSDTPLDNHSNNDVCLADVDGDGDLDLVIGPSLSRGGTVWFNDGAGHFTRSPSEITGQQSFSLATADLNGDGTFDTIYRGPGATVSLNDGAGRFTSTGQSLGNSNITGLAVADLDGDGDLDVICVGGSTAAPTGPEVFYNQTAPKARNDFYAANGMNAVVVSAASGVLSNDLTGDGGALIALLGTNPPRGSLVFSTNGSFTYTPGGSFTGTDVFYYRASDGVSTSSVTRVKIGNSAPVAVADTNYIVVNDSPLRVDAPGVLANDTDAEGDPLNALLVANLAHGSLLLRADGSFIYTAVSNYAGADSFTYKATDGFATSSVVSVTLDVRARLAVVGTVPDVNALRLGASDNIVLGFNRALNASSIATNVFVVGGFTGPHGVVATRQSAATYSGPGAALLRAASAVDVLTIDPTNSFLPDELVTVTLGAALEGSAGERQTAPAQYPFTVEAPYGLGQFVDSGQRLGSNQTYAIVLGDFERDGDLDAICGGFQLAANGTNVPATAINVYRNNGSGKFTNSGQHFGDEVVGTEAAADVNGDGVLDLLADEHMWINNGSGIFIPGQVLDPVTGGGLFCDVNGDGRPDVITWNFTNIFVWINQGGGNFSNNPASVAALDFVNLHISQIAVGDLNGDGSPDIFVMPVSSIYPCKVWLNDGHGNFRESGQEFGGGGTALTLGDVDGDGVLDAIVLNTSSSGSDYFVWLNNGDGTFTDGGQAYPGTNRIFAARLADLNGDGALDLVVLQADYATFTNTSTIFLNDGNGVFSPSGIIIGDSTRDPTNSSRGFTINRSLAIGDFNNDGAPDLYIGVDQFGGPWASQVWTNRGVLASIDGSAFLTINDNQTDTPFTNVIVRGPAIAALTLTLDNIAKGTFTPASLAAGGFTGPVGNTFTRPSGTPASAQAALRQLVFVPTLNHLPVGSNETTTFTILGNDGLVSRSNNLFSVTAVSINDPPVARNDSGPGFTGPASSSFVTASVLTNDFDPDFGDTLTIANVNTSATFGSISNLGNGTFHYTPPASLVSLPASAVTNDFFTYTIRDNHGVSAVATVTITLFGSNEAPVAVDDLITIFKNSSQVVLTATLLANDYDPDSGDSSKLTISAVNTNGTRGRVTLDPVAGVAYDPTGQFTNLADGAITLDIFTYTIRDTNGVTATATATIRIFGADRSPAAMPDALTLDEHAGPTNLNALLLTNDYDPDNGQTPLIAITAVDGSGTVGSLSFSNGIVTYDPAHRFESLRVGQTTNDTFLYTIATPTVATIAHTPVPISLLQSDTFVDVSLELSIQGTLNLTFDGQQIYTNLALPGFTPLTGARFALGGRTGGKYETHDIDDLAISVITATTTNLICDFSSNAPAGSTLLGSAIVTNGYLQLNPPQANQSGSIILPDVAPSNAIAGFTATFKVRMTSGSTPPADGFSFVWANNLTNTPFGENGAGYGLIVSFDTFDNGNGEAPAIDVKWRTPSAQALVTVSITGINDPPTAAPDFIALDEGSGTNDLTGQLLVNDSDPDDGETATLTISGISGVTTNGTLALQGGAVRYTPYANANLRVDDFTLDSFTYTVRDVNGATSNAIATIYILGTNDTFLSSATIRMTPGTNGTQRLDLPAVPRSLFELETSTNLMDWSYYASVIASTNGLAQFVEVNTTNPPVRFYRAREAGALPPGLVSYWRGDGNGLDSYGPNSGVLSNGLSFAAGQRGQAFNFDGVDDSFVIGAASMPVPWTASFWVNRQDGPDASSGLLTDSIGAIRLEQNNTRKLGFTTFGVSSYSFNYVVPTNTWTHVTMVGTTNGTQLYINGLVQDSLPQAIPLPLGTMSRPNGRIKGLVDELTVFNRPLTPPEVLSLFNATKGQTP